MENWISILISSIMLDLLSSYFVKEFFKLKIGYLMIGLLQILCITPTIMYLFMPLTLWQFILMKLIMWFAFTLLVADNYYFKNLAALYFSQVLIMFSIYGVASFLVMLVKAIARQEFSQEFSNLFDFLIIFLILCYFVAIFGFARFCSREKNLRNFLSKVSFNLFGKHIEITGLLDSGNSLYDNITGKAVVVISVCALKKILPKEVYIELSLGNFKSIGVTHYIKYVSVGGNTADMPIIDIGSVEVKMKTVSKTYECVLGFVNQPIDVSGSFECLLHRDFV